MFAITEKIKEHLGQVVDHLKKCEGLANGQLRHDLLNIRVAVECQKRAIVEPSLPIGAHWTCEHWNN